VRVPSSALCAGTLLLAGELLAEDIRDIRGPKPLSNPWLWPAVLAAALLVALAIYGVWRWRRNRRRVPRLALHELALAELEAARPLMAPASADEFCVAASAILRRYLEQRFDIVATLMTTDEFLYQVSTSADSALAAQRGMLTSFLVRCDVVKFAGSSLTSADLQSLYDSARGLILAVAANAAPVGK
jgi:Domain of unknown function (DUF4381)